MRKSGKPGDPLSEDSLEILQAKSEGLSDRQVGNKLEISEETVGARLTRTYWRMGLYNPEDTSKEPVNKLTRAVCLALEKGLIQGPPLRNPAPELDELELPVIRLLPTGAGNKQIAHSLGLTEPIVKHRLVTASEKCGVSSRTELAAVAIVHQLI